MLSLAAETRPDWFASVRDHLPELLVDHAHCEKKAASTIINLIFRYPDQREMVRRLSEVAREELEHFELCLDLLERRGIAFGRLDPSPYAKRLHAAVRKGEPEQLLDTLLVCALIEARSCERMKILSESLEDAELRGFYAGLLASEARHFTLYVDLASQRFGAGVARERLSELAAHEAAVISAGSPEPRVHS